MNRNNDKMTVVRRKILWSHARGNINLSEEASIPTADMARILAWTRNDSDETCLGNRLQPGMVIYSSCTVPIFYFLL